jgi:hypothetical protein
MREKKHVAADCNEGEEETHFCVCFFFLFFRERDRLGLISCKIRGVQNQTNPIENRKPNQTKPKPQKTAFGSDLFGSFSNKTARFGLVCGLYFSNRTKPNQTALCYNSNFNYPTSNPKLKLSMP